MFQINHRTLLLLNGSNFYALVRVSTHHPKSKTLLSDPLKKERSNRPDLNYFLPSHKTWQRNTDSHTDLQQVSNVPPKDSDEYSPAFDRPLFEYTAVLPVDPVARIHVFC